MQSIFENLWKVLSLFFFFFFKFIFYFIYFLLKKATKKKKNLESWLSQLSNSWVKKGGGGFLAPFFYLHLFLSSLFLLPPLLLFTSFFHLHFLHPHTLSSLESHFPKLLNLSPSISLNISSDFCVLDDLCYKAIFLHFQWHLPRDHLFLLSMERNIIHLLNGMRKRGSFKILRPMLHTLKRTSRWANFFFFFGFFVGKFVGFMFCWELGVETLSFCCCLFLLEFWTLYGLVENSCVIMLCSIVGHENYFFGMGFFWTWKFFGWILGWVFCGHLNDWYVRFWILGYACFGRSFWLWCR